MQIFKKHTTPAPKATLADRQQLINGTLKRYQSRRKQKLTSDINFELDLELKYVETTSKDEVHEEFIIKPESEDISDYQELFKTFYTKIRRLLILGAPGSGKTLLLLRLGEFLMDKAQEGKIFPVPIIVNLASWRSDESSFAEWLEKQLPHSAGEGGISKEYAKILIEENQVLPLLDGLDEIPAHHRASLLKALDKYLAKRQARVEIASSYPEVIICSRIKEFEELKIAPEIYGTVAIQSLTKTKVQETLSELALRNNLPAKRLLNDLQQYPILSEAVDTAFYVHSALSLYSDGKPKDDFFNSSTKEAQQKVIIQTYLNQQFKELNYPSSKARHWLGWLATGLAKSKKGVSFELADLQLYWLNRKKTSLIVYGLLFGLFFGLAASLLIGLVFDPFQGLFVGLAFVIIGGLLFGTLGDHTIQYKDTIGYKLKNIKLKSFLQYLAYGILEGLLGGLLGGLLLSPFGGLFFGLVFGLIIGLLFGLIFGLEKTFKQIQRFPKVENVYQRFKSEFLSSIVTTGGAGMLVLPILTLQSFSIVNNPFQDASYITTMLFGLLIGMAAGIFRSIFYEYFILYLLLLFHRVIPLRLVRFLNQTAEKTGLMEKDGGQWRFRHQLIQDALVLEYEAGKV